MDPRGPQRAAVATLVLSLMVVGLVYYAGLVGA